MDSSDYPKTKMELHRDAGIAELALRVQPLETHTKELGISKRKSTKKQQTQVQPFPTHKSARIGSKDTKAINEHANDAEHMSASEEIEPDNSGSTEEDNQSEEDDGHLLEEDSSSRHKRVKLAVSVPPFHGGFSPQSMQQSAPRQWQWQWVPPQSMPPPPSQLPQWTMVDSRVLAPSWQVHGQSQEVLCKSDSIGRFITRKRQKEFEKNPVARSGNGKKPNEVHVTSYGEIDTSSSGKTAWNQNMKAFAPLILDMSVIDWDKHKPHTLKKLRDTMDAKFDYVGHPLSNKGFQNTLQRFLRDERCRLKKLSDPEKDDDCPVQINPDQWKQLKAYWDTGNQFKNSEMMSNARKQVQNVSKRGRRRKAGEEADMVVSSGLHAKLIAMESEFEKFRVEVLVNTDRNTKAIEALQATLMKFLQKENIVGGGNEVLTTTIGSPFVVDDPYDLFTDYSLILEPIGGQQPSLQDNKKDSTDKETPKIVSEEEKSIENPKTNDCGQCNGSDEPVPKGNKVEGKVDEPVTKGNEVEGKDDIKSDVVVLDGPSLSNEVPKNPSKDREFSMQLRKGKDHEKPCAKKEILRIKMQPTQTQKLVQSSKESLPKQKLQFAIGQEVSLVNPSTSRQVVASGTITAIGGGPGPQLYHGQPIPKGWCRLDIAHAPGGFVDLMHPNLNGDELKLKDVVGGNTIWDEQYIVIIPRVARPIFSNNKGRK